MRAALLCVVVIVACGGDEPEADVPIAAPNVPRVADASAVASPLAVARPSVIVWLDDNVAAQIGRVSTPWDGTLPAQRTTTTDLVRDVTAGVASLPVDKRVASVTRDGPRPGTAATTPLAILAPVAPLVVASPTAPASLLAGLLRDTGGAVAVLHGGQLRVLAIGFERAPPTTREPGDDPGRWIELHLDGPGVHVVAPGSEPTLLAWLANGALDRDRVLSAIDLLRDGETLPIDILGGDHATVQQLVDTIVALGPRARELAIGPLDEKRVGVAPLVPPIKTVPDVVLGVPNAQGDLDKVIIRNAIKANLTKVQYCYEKGLLVKPQLAGKIMIQFFIAPSGKVASVSASGVDAEVASCVSDVIEAIEFPKPKGGGGVQVTYPFIFRPAP